MDLNHWSAIGKIEDDPIAGKNSGKIQAFFNLIINRKKRDANGQWIDNYSKAPCYAFDNKADAILNNCSAGQEVAVEAYYHSWKKNDGSDAHGMILQSISFGYKPKNQ